MRIIKRMTNKTVPVAVSAALFCSVLCGTLSLALPSEKSARAEEFKEYATTSLDLANTQFSETSGSYPATPSSWTGAAVGGGSGNIVSGVVDLTPSKYVAEGSGNEKFKLDQYPEYSNASLSPVSLFYNNASYPGADANALLINTTAGAESAYAYTSAEMSFESDSFYRVSAWVKTGNFASDTGATIKLTGLDEDISFTNINTVKDLQKDSSGNPILTRDNNFGWQQYTFYVRTSASLTQTVQLVLGIGDASENSAARFAKGYAFFDTVNAERISPEVYANDTANYVTADADTAKIHYDATATSMAINLYDTKSLTVDINGTATEIGTFSENTSIWNVNADYDPDSNDDISYAGQSSVMFYNSYTSILPDDNEYGLSANPLAPLGKAENNGENKSFTGKNGNILMISTYDGNRFNTAARGVASPDITIERFKYYRLSVWVKSDSVMDGTGVSVAIRGQANNTSNNNKLDQWYNNLTGSDTAAAQYGWNEHVVYISGSVLSDLNVHFEFWLGTPGSPSSGIAMFDNVTFTELSYSDYTAMTAADGENTVSMDAAATDTGITNGNFMSIGDYEDFEYPLPAAEWKYYNASTVGANGFANNAVDTDNVVHGIIPTDTPTFNTIAASGALPGIINPHSFVDAPLYNTLVISSSTPTAVCYQSPQVTAATDIANKVTVSLAVRGVTEGNYGASLVLKTTDGDVISTIENITNTNNAFKTYTFYLNAPLEEKTLFVEVWLGLNDRTNNTHKLSNGTVYVKSVSFAEWSSSEGEDSVDDQFSALLNQYKQAVKAPNTLKTLDYGIYSFRGPSLNYFDAYSYYLNETLGTPYQWSRTSSNSSIIGGVFNTENIKNGVPVYKGFDKKDYSGNMLLIYNTELNRTTYKYGNEVLLVANTYYRLDVTIKVNVSKEMRESSAVGANIALSGTKTDAFENIKDTSTLIAQNNEDSRDYETFKTYTFYISTGDNGGSVGLNISFGGDARSEFIQGQLIVADVSFTSITNTVYQDSIDNLNKDYELKVELSSTDNSDDSGSEAPSGDIAWWIIPTVIFSVCLIAAIAVIIVLRIRDRFKKKKKTTYTAEYDRAHTDKRLAALDLAESLKKSTGDLSDESNDFDDSEKPDPDAQTDNNTVTDADKTESQETADANKIAETESDPHETDKSGADSLDD